MARVISQAVDENGNVFLLKDDGILEKRSPLNVPIWSQQTRIAPTTASLIYANQIALDIDDNVWLVYDDQLNLTVRSGSTGLLLTEVLGTAASVIVPATGGEKMFAMSRSRALVYEISRVTKVLIRSFDLVVKIPGFTAGVFTSQIASSLAGMIWFPALIGPVGGPKTTALVKFDPSANGVFTCYPVPAANGVPIISVGADVTGKIYAASIHGSIFRFDESVSVNAYDAFYSPVAPGGVIDIVTFTGQNQPILVDDGTFAFAGGKTRTMNPANGDLLSSISSVNVGTVTGDVLGYQHIKLTRINVPPPVIVPAVDVNKLKVFVKPDGTITFTGRPGFVQNAQTVTCIRDAVPLTPVGSVAPNDDGSFSITSAPGLAVPGGEPCTVKAIYGLQIVTIAVTSQPRSIPTAFDTQFQTSGLVIVGSPARLKAKIFNFTGGPVTVPAPAVLPIFRLKRDFDGKWFDGVKFVSDNGDYIQPSFDPDGQFWYADVTFPLGETSSISFVVKDSPPFSTNLVLLPPLAENADVEEILAIVTSINERLTQTPFDAPAINFGDPATFGGFVLSKLNDIQRSTRRLLQGLVGARNVVVESIAVDVARQSVAKGSTPSIDITVWDEERRFPRDITGGRVFFRAKVNLASPVLIIDEEAQIVDGPTGQAQAHLTAQDTATAQRLSGQIVVILPGTGVLVSPPFVFDIQESVL